MVPVPGRGDGVNVRQADSAQLTVVSRVSLAEIKGDEDPTCLLTRPMTKTRSAPRRSVDPRGTDYFGLRDELTDAERDYLRRTRAFVDNDVLPVTNDYWQRAEFPWPLIKKMGTLGIVGDGIEGYVCPAMATAPEAVQHQRWIRR